MLSHEEQRAIEQEAQARKIERVTANAMVNELRKAHLDIAHGMIEREERAMMKARPVVQPDPKLNASGAPTRATTFAPDAAGRKRQPVVSGVLDYFPDAMIAIAEVSFAGNEQHNPGQPLHWNRGKSADEADACGRHLLQRGTRDDDGMRHSAKMAWRALALLQKEIEEERRANRI